MRKLLFLFAMLTLAPTLSWAQCSTSTEFAAQGNGIYPRPSGVNDPANGWVGIDEEATIGVPFSYDFTVQLPTTFVEPFTMITATNDSLIIIPDSTYTTFNGVRTLGLPEGLSMVSSTPDFKFLPNDNNPAGCFAIAGTPSGNLAPGDYFIEYYIKTCLRIPPIFEGCQETFIPNDDITVNIPGVYRLTINEPEGCSVDPATFAFGNGIIPRPSGVNDPAQGWFGINEDATIGEFFDFTFQVNVPSSFQEPFTMLTATNDSVIVIADSIFTTFNGVRTLGLPAGLSFSSSAPDNKFFPNDSEPAGCFQIAGVPDASLTPGNYLIEFKVKTCLKIIPVFDDCQEVFVPTDDITVNLPGVYELTILQSVSTSNLLEQQANIRNLPNPFGDYTQFEFDMETAGNYNLQIFDAMGRIVHHETIRLTSGVNLIDFDAQHLNAGLYYYSLSNELGQISQKMVISK
ncbi:MAG: T9SS type A sorting domain-containing protein [Bacteroidota bacterium]